MSVNWTEITACITIPAMFVGILFVVSQCDIRGEEERTKRIIAEEEIKQSLADKGFSAREIRCATGSDELLCVALRERIE